MFIRHWRVMIVTMVTALLAYGPVSASNRLAQPMAQRIVFGPGSSSAAVTGQVAPGDVNYWVVGAQAGQTLSVSLSFTYGQAILIIYGADGNVLLSDHGETAVFSGFLPTTQDYFIVVRGNFTTSTSYSMGVSIPPLAGPLPASRRIQFAPGATAVSVSGQISGSGTDRWVLSAFGGQNMSANIAGGLATLSLAGANGAILVADNAGVATFNVALPASQDYYISVRGNPNTNYTLNITVPPLFAPPSTNNISFGPGGTSASVNGQLAASGSNRWAVSAQAGQTMTAQLTFGSGQAILIVWGADGTVLLSDHAGVSAFTGILPSTQVYYIDVRGNPATSTSYTLTVTIPPLTPGSDSRRITFAPGADSAAVQGLVAANSTNVWVLRVNGGQTMYAQVIYANQPVVMSVTGADGSVLQSSQSGLGGFNGVLPSTQDYVITITGDPSIPATYTLTISIPPRYG